MKISLTLVGSARLRRERLSSVAAAADSVVVVGVCSVHHTPLVSIGEEQYYLLCLDLQMTNPGICIKEMPHFDTPAVWQVTGCTFRALMTTLAGVKCSQTGRNV